MKCPVDDGHIRYELNSRIGLRYGDLCLKPGHKKVKENESVDYLASWRKRGFPNLTAFTAVSSRVTVLWIRTPSDKIEIVWDSNCDMLER